MTASPAFNRTLLSLLDCAPDCIVCIDRDWNFSFANQQAVTFLNAGPLVGENIFELFPGNAEEPYNSSYRTAMERGIPTEFEAYYGPPLNVWFKVFARPFEDGIIVFFSDITARKKAEARRDANARQLEQVLEATTDGVVSFARDWTFTYLNRSARELLSIKGDLIGRNLWEEFPAAHAGKFRYHLEQAMVDRVPSDLEDFYPEPLNLWLSVQCRPSDDGIVVFFRDVSEQRKAHQALLDQQNTLAFVQETARVATWRADFIARTITFAQGSYAVFGHPPQNLRTFDDLIRHVHPDDIDRVIQAARSNLRAGNPVIVDFRVIAADGSVLWVEARGLPVLSEEGILTHIRGMFTDITSRRQNLEELAASEERYRVLADLNPQAIWMGDPDGRIVYANQGFLDYIGFTMEQASTDTGWLNGFYKEDRTRVLEAWNYSVSTGEEYEIEARMIRSSDGACRWWWLRALPVRDDSGKILSWIGVAMDIHDRKTYAEALRAQQEETERQRAVLEAIYDTAPIGLALFDPVEFRYLRVNDRQAETIGLPKDKIIGRPITEIAPLKGLRELFQQVSAGIPVRNRLLEGELPTRPGEHRYWNVSYSPIYDPDGSVEAIAAVVQEITNQKKAEAALIQSEKLAAVGRLASSISHEINNPLEAITNIFYLIERDSSLPPELKPLVHMAQSELSRVCQIATQTLRFHRQAVRATQVTAQQLVRAVLDLYQGRLSNTGITVDAHYSCSTPILCLENDIRQVLNNLIANAIDAMRQNGGRLLVRAHDTVIYPEGHNTASSPIRAVRITIADTGHGMTPEVRARIFEPFYTTKDLNGTGLGLWISSGIVARHKGRLTLRTSVHPVHHGTIFSLTLPTEQEPAISAV
jgi:PAS domain S-box-containing protein